jgi:hypothetical protein
MDDARNGPFHMFASKTGLLNFVAKSSPLIARFAIAMIEKKPNVSKHTLSHDSSDRAVGAAQTLHNSQPVS